MNTAMLLIVLSAKDPNALAEFYSRLGLEFRSERSGAGPEHFRCVTKDLVFEIHPIGNGSGITIQQRDAAQSIRSGVIGP